MAFCPPQRFGMQRSGGIDVFRRVGGGGHGRFPPFYFVIPGHRAATNPESITIIGSMDSPMCDCTSEACDFVAPRNDGLSIHPEKIALADFHAVMPENAVRGGGMEVE